MQEQLEAITAGISSFRRTPQRLAIVEYLRGNTSHPSAEDVYRDVSKRHRSLSLATVYNTLNALVAAGAVRELTIDPERRRYDPFLQPHHHLFCTECRQVSDIKGTVTVALPRGAVRGFAVIETRVDVYGSCPSCRGRKRVQ